MNGIPYREGDEPPSPQHILVQQVDEDGHELGKVWVLPDEIRRGPIRHDEW